MNTDEPAPLDDALAPLVAACDDALARGAGTLSLDESAVPAELRPRVQNVVAWCRLVRELLPRGGPPGSGPTLPALPPPAAAPPSRIGRFLIRRELGHGTFGVVFLAHDPDLARPVAVKVPRAEALVSPGLRARFRQEARAAAGLEHPNLVPVYEAGEDGPVCYIVSAYCPGVTLAAWLKEQTEPVPYRTAARLVATLAEAMEHAHRRGILHRDLKPGNILLEPLAGGPGGDGLDFVPRITDFGLARYLAGQAEAGEAGCQTGTGAIVGTPQYMAPEQAGAAKEIGPAADVYALGAILYELLTGRPPLQADSSVETLVLVRTQEPLPPSRLRPRLPRDLETVCLKCLRKEPHQRYASAGALAEDLHRYLGGEPVRARRVGRLGRFVRWCRRNPVVAVTVAAAVLAVGAVGGAGLWGVLRERDNYRAERDRAEGHLYQSLVGQARAVRLARGNGYREEVWDLLDQARRLETPARDLAALRQEAVACMGDFVSLPPTVWPSPPNNVYWVALALHPNGREAALGLTDGTVRLHALPGGAETACLRGHATGVFALAFGPDGKFLVSADDGGTIKVWRPAEGAWQVTQTLTMSRSAWPDHVGAACLAVTGGGRRLLACVRGAPSVSVWDLATGAAEAPFRGPQGELVFELALSPDGRRLAGAAGDAGDGVLVWDVPTRKFLQAASPDVGTVNHLAFSPDGRWLACAGGTGAAVLDAANLQPRWSAGGEGRYTVGFSPDSRLLAVPSGDLGAVQLWDVATNREAAALKLQGNEPHTAAFSEDGDTLVVVAAGAVGVWDLRGGGERRALRGHTGAVGGAAFRADGRLLASAGNEGTVRLWDPVAGRAVAVLGESAGSALCVAFSPDGRLLVTGHWGGAVRLWDVTDPQKPRDRGGLEDDSGSIAQAVAFSPDGKYFALGTSEGVVIWRVSPGAPGGSVPSSRCFERCAQLPGRGVDCLGFSPDGELLAWRGQDEFLHLWEVASARPRRWAADPDFEQRHSRGIGFCRGGKHLIFLNDNKSAEVRDLATGELAYAMGPIPLPGQNNWYTGRRLSLDPSGTLLAAQFWDVPVWDLRSRSRLFSLPRGPAAPTCLEWDPEGKLLAVGSADGALAVWDLPAMRAELARIGLDW